jgi:hypothetical protein
MGDKTKKGVISYEIKHHYQFCPAVHMLPLLMMCACMCDLGHVQAPPLTVFKSEKCTQKQQPTNALHGEWRERAVRVNSAQNSNDAHVNGLTLRMHMHTHKHTHTHTHTHTSQTADMTYQHVACEFTF